MTFLVHVIQFGFGEQAAIHLEQSDQAKSAGFSQLRDNSYGPDKITTRVRIIDPKDASVFDKLEFATPSSLFPTQVMPIASAE